MKPKSKKLMAFGMSILMALSTASLTEYTVNKSEEKFKDNTTSFSDNVLEPTIINENIIYDEIVKEAIVDSETIRNIKLERYDEVDINTYYVHSNGKRTILSEKENLDGYELQGGYTSFSSAEAIVFKIIDNEDGTVTCKVVSYDDMVKMSSQEKSRLYIINEEAPVDAFVPCISNDKDISKKLSK